MCHSDRMKTGYECMNFRVSTDQNGPITRCNQESRTPREQEFIWNLIITMMNVQMKYYIVKLDDTLSTRN